MYNTYMWWFQFHKLLLNWKTN